MGRANALLEVLPLIALGCGRGQGAQSTGDMVELGAELQDCPTISTLSAIDSTASTTAPGNTSTIYASAAAPDPKMLDYKFSIKSGTGTLSGQKNASNKYGTSSSIVFTCPDKDEVSSIQIEATDETGATSCPASLTTATTTVTCEAAR